MRCSWCHGPLDGSPTSRCERCGTVLHADCADQAASCPTLGCERRGRNPAKAGQGPGRVWSCLALALITAAMLGGCCVIASSAVPRPPFQEAERLIERATRRTPPEQIVAAGRRLIADRELVARIQAQGGVPAWNSRVPATVHGLPSELEGLGHLDVLDDRIETYMGGGFGGWGVLILGEDAAPPDDKPPHDLRHYREVCPGLWIWGNSG